MTSTWFRGVNIWLGVGEIATNQDVEVIGEHIHAITSHEAATPPSDRVDLDLSGKWVTPGLIDLHTHLTLHRSAPERSELHLGSVFTAVRSARETLAGGVTTCRDVGGYKHTDLALRDAIARGDVQGPRVFAAGLPIASTGGHIHYFTREADGVGEVRKAVREQIKAGADLIKLMLTGGSANVGERPRQLQMQPDEIRAAIDVARHADIPVAAHAHTTEAIVLAANAGATTVEHGALLDETAIETLLDTGCALVPTQAVYARLAANTDGWPESKARAAQELHDNKRIGLAKAIAAGVRLGIGTDSGRHFPHGRVADEMAALVTAGYEPEQTLHAATAGNARLLGIEAETGTVEVGKVADLAVYDSDPRIDPVVLGKPHLVVTRGRIFDSRAVEGERL